MTILDRKLFAEACDSPLTQRLLAEMLTARLVYHVTKHDPSAGHELYASDPRACEAVAAAEAENLTAEERLEIRGDLPERVEQYCARAWSLIDDTLSVLTLPPEVIQSISGDMIALFAAGLLTKDVREAEDADDGERREAA